MQPEQYCRHANQALARRVFSNGIEHFGSQCLDCGKWDGGIKKSTLNEAQMEAAVTFDPEVARRFSERQREAFQQERQAKNEAFWQKYHDHLNSDDWRRACLERRATQAHHLTYRHLGWEPLFDLIAVCKQCHEYLHKKERELNVTSN